MPASGRSSDSGALPRRLPGPRASGSSARERPSQRRDRPGLAPGPSPLAFCCPPLCPSVQAAVRRWGPVVAWAAVIFAFSSIPSLGTGLGTWDLVLRKIAHATEFAILAALLFRALRHTGWAIAIAIAYAVSDEIHQSFVSGRCGPRGMWASMRRSRGRSGAGLEAVARRSIRSRWVDCRVEAPKDVGDRQLMRCSSDSIG